MQIDLPRMIAAAAELRRELGIRERLYPRWISARTLKPEDADRQLARLRDAIAVVDAAVIAAGGAAPSQPTQRSFADVD